MSARGRDLPRPRLRGPSSEIQRFHPLRGGSGIGPYDVNVKRMLRTERLRSIATGGQPPIRSGFYDGLEVETSHDLLLHRAPLTIMPETINATEAYRPAVAYLHKVVLEERDEDTRRFIATGQLPPPTHDERMPRDEGAFRNAATLVLDDPVVSPVKHRALRNDRPRTCGAPLVMTDEEVQATATALIARDSARNMIRWQRKEEHERLLSNRYHMPRPSSPDTVKWQKQLHRLQKRRTQEIEARRPCRRGDTSSLPAHGNRRFIDVPDARETPEALELDMHDPTGRKSLAYFTNAYQLFHTPEAYPLLTPHNPMVIDGECISSANGILPYTSTWGVQAAAIPLNHHDPGSALTMDPKTLILHINAIFQGVRRRRRTTTRQQEEEEEEEEDTNVFGEHHLYVPNRKTTYPFKMSQEERMHRASVVQSDAPPTFLRFGLQDLPTTPDLPTGPRDIKVDRYLREDPDGPDAPPPLMYYQPSSAHPMFDASAQQIPHLRLQLDDFPLLIPYHMDSTESRHIVVTPVADKHYYRVELQRRGERVVFLSSSTFGEEEEEEEETNDDDEARRRRRRKRREHEQQQQQQQHGQLQHLVLFERIHEDVLGSLVCCASVSLQYLFVLLRDAVSPPLYAVVRFGSEVDTNVSRVCGRRLTPIMRAFHRADRAGVQNYLVLRNLSYAPIARYNATLPDLATMSDEAITKEIPYLFEEDRFPLSVVPSTIAVPEEPSKGPEYARQPFRSYDLGAWAPTKSQLHTVALVYTTRVILVDLERGNVFDVPYIAHVLSLRLQYGGGGGGGTTTVCPLSPFHGSVAVSVKCPKGLLGRDLPRGGRPFARAYNDRRTWIPPAPRTSSSSTILPRALPPCGSTNTREKLYVIYCLGTDGERVEVSKTMATPPLMQRQIALRHDRTLQTMPGAAAAFLRRRTRRTGDSGAAPGMVYRMALRIVRWKYEFDGQQVACVCSVIPTEGTNRFHRACTWVQVLTFGRGDPPLADPPPPLLSDLNCLRIAEARRRREELVEALKGGGGPR